MRELKMYLCVAALVLLAMLVLGCGEPNRAPLTPTPRAHGMILHIVAG